ncbi:sensor histidine kinase N-terminal domain-containing protein [Pannonibacter sp. Pt2-lr]
MIISEGDMLTEPLLEELTAALGDPVYYRITGPGGSFVTGYSHSPRVPEGIILEDGEPSFFDSLYFGSEVRAVMLRSSLPIPASTAGSPLKCGRPPRSAAR